MVKVEENTLTEAQKAEIMAAAKAQNEAAAEVAKAKAEKQRLDEKFGRGRLGPVCWELYRDCQNLLGMSPQEAERVASCLQADVGRLTANQPIKNLIVGKMGKKDDMVTIKTLSDKLPKVHLSFSLACLKACQLLQEAKAFRVVESYDTISLQTGLKEWLHPKD